uniref:Uncharacterized protein n=1 Tax=Nymphaea colorata TaxID=210225 RepID=A0A5K1ATK8_9MAGN
MRPRPCPQP